MSIVAIITAIMALGGVYYQTHKSYKNGLKII